jgi:hypothetical protein
MLAVAERRAGDCFLADAPQSPPTDLVATLTRRAKGGAVLLGFDFPIGLPEAYAAAAGIDTFPTWLAHLADGVWDRFRTPAAVPAEIASDRPYFPLRPGGASQATFVAAHGAASYRDLLRRCDRGTTQRAGACCMFWTLGAKQCGRAALAGWHEVVRPGLLARGPLAIWPFAGALSALLDQCGCVVAETYPAEFYAELGPRRRFSKRRQADRQSLAPGIRQAAARVGLVARPELAQAIDAGFGPHPDGENAFDAVIGLIGMVLVLRGMRPADPPDDPAVRRHEGWMLGLDQRTLRS